MKLWAIPLAMLALAACDSAAPTKAATGDATAAADTSKSDAAISDGGAKTDTTANAGTDAGGDAAPADTASADAGQPNIDVSGGPNDLLLTGDYFMGVQAAPFGNIQLPFRVSVVAEGSLDKGGKILALQLRSMSQDLTFTSEPIATALNIAVAAGGAFSVKIDNVVLPAKASPTGTDVPLNMVLVGKILSKTSFCGDVDGDVPQFEVKLTGSKFKAIPFGSQKVPYESSCEGNQAKIYKGIDACPAILPGENTITSAERQRTFIVQLPKGASSTDGLPIVFLYHGVGGSPDSMIDTSGLTAEQEKTPFILVSSRSERDKNGKAVLKTDWYYGAPQFDMDNPDLVLFDDLLKCVGAQYKANPKRIYATGMSGGGLMSSFLGVHRGKVLAAVSPFSGGYLHPWPADSGKVPFAYSWGGTTDFAYEQNFDAMADKVLKALKGSGHFVVACNHGLGHKWPKEGGNYAAKFLLAHTLGGPEPFANGLGDGWPAYCKVY